MNRSGGGCLAAWIFRAGVRSSERRCGVWPSLQHGHAGRHGAVMRSVASAAGGQARFLVGGEQARKRPQPKHQNQENANNTPHLALMLHGNGLRVLVHLPAGEKPGLPVKYYRGIAWVPTHQRTFP